MSNASRFLLIPLGVFVLAERVPYVPKRFPKDVQTYGIDRQFLWGKSLLVTPVLDPGVDSVVGYFPEGLWYDYYTVRPTLLLSPFSSQCCKTG